MHDVTQNVYYASTNDVSATVNKTTRSGNEAQVPSIDVYYGEAKVKVTLVTGQGGYSLTHECSHYQKLSIRRDHSYLSAGLTDICF